MAVAQRSNVKTNVAPVNGREILEQLARLPVATWSYTARSRFNTTHRPHGTGLLFRFCVGEDDRYISSVDADGVALAAIQGCKRLCKTGTSNRYPAAVHRGNEDEIAAQRNQIAILRPPGDSGDETPLIAAGRPADPLAGHRG
jgi:hypothetical protein